MKNYQIILPIILSSFLCQAQTAKELSYGTAKDSKGLVLYKEKHTSRFIQGKLDSLLTQYYYTENKIFASLQSDFSQNESIPNYKFEDSRFARMDGIKRSANKIVAFKKENKDDKMLDKVFTTDEDTVAGQGLHNYIRIHLDDFVANKEHKKNIKFLIPMNQDMYNFRILTHSIDNEKKEIKIRIEAKSWLFRFIAPHIDVIYNIDSHRLIEYKGPSNLLSDDGKNRDVIISYTYD
jgi:hypothetical protein